MMKQKSIRILVFFITILSIVATSYAIVSNQGPGAYEYQSIFGETISIYGKGLYKHDSVSMAVQAIAQDYVTLFIGVPLLILSLHLSRKGRRWILGLLFQWDLFQDLLLIKRKPFGYLLGSVIIIKDITLLTALSAMVFLQIQAGVKVSLGVVTLVLLLNIFVIYLMVIMLKNVKEVSV
jgi:hypothetical protein